jgi:hypothetical protein
MSACEKCWRDSRLANNYTELLFQRHTAVCTPEQQAGPDARVCEVCGRRTRHQITGECMACGDMPEVVA